MLANIGITLFIVLIIMGLIFGCCIPILRSMITSRLEKEMVFTVTDIAEPKGLEWVHVTDAGHSGDYEKYGPVKSYISRKPIQLSGKAHM